MMDFIKTLCVCTYILRTLRGARCPIKSQSQLSSTVIPGQCLWLHQLAVDGKGEFVSRELHSENGTRNRG